MARICGSAGFHFINKVDKLKDIHFAPGQGLVMDEQGWRDRAVDDVKGIIDLKKPRDVACRNRDGHIPAETPRIITTNHKREIFFPHEAFEDEHATAIYRRSCWVPIKGDLRRRHRAATAAVAAPVQPADSAEYDEAAEAEKMEKDMAEAMGRDEEGAWYGAGIDDD
jgi:hypothetical protein